MDIPYDDGWVNITLLNEPCLFNELGYGEKLKPNIKIETDCISMRVEVENFGNL